MFLSLSVIFILALLASKLCSFIKLPGLIGMLLVGILIGPHALNLIDSSILDISSELRKIALIIILTRAGLNLDIEQLKKVGRPAFLMCFLPATVEIAGMLIFAPKIFDISVAEAALLGAVIAAVSPAVVVPRMLKLIETDYGKQHGIPQIIMAGASVDDVYVIVLFSSFVTLVSGEKISPLSFLAIPTSIIFGVVAGGICALILHLIFGRFQISTNVKVIVFMSVSFILVTVEDSISGFIGFSGLLGIMSMSAVYQKKNYEDSRKISVAYSSLWCVAEILLFVLVGANVDIGYASKFGFKAVILIIVVTLFRMLGVLICVLKTNLDRKERVFCMIAYTPKATVQAAIGSIPLSMGLKCGSLVLTVSVLAILITASLGAFAIDNSYKRLLK